MAVASYASFPTRRSRSKSSMSGWTSSHRSGAVLPDSLFQVAARFLGQCLFQTEVSMDDRLLEAIRGGSAVVTAGRRLARHLRQDYDAIQQSAGILAWPAPDRKSTRLNSS